MFGDLRATNIMVVGQTVKRGMLVDFDWVGKHNEDRYPPIINNMLIGKSVCRDIYDKWALQKIREVYRKVISDS